MRTTAALVILRSAALLLFLYGSAAAIPGEGLVGHWNFGASDGKTVADHSPLGNTGSIDSGALVAEKGTHSLAFDGFDTSVTIAEARPFGINGALTAAVWIRPQSFRRHALIFGRPHRNGQWTTPMFGMVLNENKAVFGMFNAKGDKALVDSGSELLLQTWVHVAASYDGARLRVYVNGEFRGEKEIAGAVGENGLPLYLGNPPERTSPPYAGRVGELCLWKRALTPRELQALFLETRDAYDLTPGKLAGAARRDGTVRVESPGNTPGPNWRAFPTRIMEKLDAWKTPAVAPRLNRYGGWLDPPKESATGFFYTRKLGERWWIIDPEGCRYIHIGMDQVAPIKSFEKALASTFGTKEQWAEDTSALFYRHAFNGKNTRNTNEIALMRAVSRPLAYTWLMRFASSFAEKRKMTYATAGHTGFTNECIPVFHPDFERHCDEQARPLASLSGDPYFFGIFSDNELQCPLDLLDRHLAQDWRNEDQRPGIEAARAWLLARRATTNLEGLRRRDRLEFIAHVFERYYRVVRDAIRRYDPHHLYIGTRICYSAQFDNPYFMRMAAKYLDVASINYYGVWGPDLAQMAAWDESFGKPVLFSEWYAKAEDTGLANTHGAGWLVRTQADRAAYYQHTVLGYLEAKTCVGWHFFKYQDDPAESKALDAAGGANKGMFATNYAPHQPLFDWAGDVNRQAYPLTGFFDARK